MHNTWVKRIFLVYVEFFLNVERLYEIRRYSYPGI
jgi:hypothetical protein